MTLVLGLTGSIASGKSTVSNMFNDFNIPVIDADRLAREVVRPGEKAYEKIISTFTNEILLPDGSIDRDKLGEIVFAEEEKRKQLNAIVHPAVRAKMIEQRDQLIDENVPAVVLDIPLLFENQLTDFVERIIVVAVTPDVQLQRLMARNGYTADKARQRVDSQMPVAEKAQKADAVIDNNGSIESTKSQLEMLLQRWNVI